jgi:hypothetical protein
MMVAGCGIVLIKNAGLKTAKAENTRRNKSMIRFNPENKDTLTYGEALKPAMEIKNKGEARQYLYDYATFIQKYLDKEPDTQGRTAIQIAKINIGYFAGYYDNETNKRVQELFETVHPIFGKTTPAPEEALLAGEKLATNEGTSNQKKEENKKPDGYMIYKKANEAITILIHRVGKKEKRELLDLMRDIVQEAVQLMDNKEYEHKGDVQ